MKRYLVAKRALPPRKGKHDVEQEEKALLGATLRMIIVH